MLVNHQQAIVKLATIFSSSALSLYGFYIVLMYWQLEKVYSNTLLEPITGVSLVAAVVSIVGTMLPLKTYLTMVAYSIAFSFSISAVLVAVLGN